MYIDVRTRSIVYSHGEWLTFKNHIDGYYSSLSFAYEDVDTKYRVVTEVDGGFVKEITINKISDAYHIDWESNWKALQFRHTSTYIQSLSIDRSAAISGGPYSPGNLTLTGPLWDAYEVDFCHLSLLTASTNWDLYICYDNTFDLTDARTLKLVANATGNIITDVHIRYISSTTSLYLIYNDLSGSATANIHIIGTTKIRAM